MIRWIGLLLLPSLLFGRCWQTADLCQDATFGPEVYHLERTRAGGIQEGWLFGCRGSYDRIRSNGFYFGGEGHYGKGSLRGHSRRRDPL
ncbi:MAG: hypothetical protein JSR80_07665, partial [Verrucomicrobia bacterium]|nr:hypothetical protein [Verrucomicrobiota bacterium]